MLNQLGTTGINPTWSWYIIQFMYCYYTHLWSPTLKGDTHTHTHIQLWLPWQHVGVTVTERGPHRMTSPQDILPSVSHVFGFILILQFLHFITNSYFSVMSMTVSTGLSRKTHSSFSFISQTEHLWHFWSPKEWGFLPHQAILCNISWVSYNSPQFWHYLPGVSVRSQVKGSAPWDCIRFTCQLQVPGCYLYFWLASYKLGFPWPLSGIR